MADESHTYVGKLLLNLIKLIPIEFEDLKTFWGFEDELNQLRESLVAIAGLVEGAEQKQHRDWIARWWLGNLKEEAYEADDLLSDLAYETTRLQVHSSSLISRAIKNARKDKFRRQMMSKLEKVNKSLRIIQKNSVFLQLSSIPHNLEDWWSRNRLPTDSIIDSSVVGRQADVAKIVNLITSSCYQQLTIVPIIGTGGVGKTTVAKLVCQKVMALTRKPFDVKIWVSLSENFSEYKVLGEILRSLNASIGGLTKDDTIVQQLKKELVSKKFLLVLDDVSNKIPRWWVLLKTLLSRICTNSGNAIIVTTRSKKVALIIEEASSQHSHRLNLLSEDESWLILKERAFGKVAKPVPSSLEAIGREVAKRCGGSPLIAKVLGGIMGFNRDEETWLRIRAATVWKENDSLRTMLNQIVDLLLPLYLKPCIAFCSIFPKDFLFRKEELIWLWMAEGIVESYDMGNKCFDALLASSVLQDVEKDDYDDIILCRMHDLVLSVFKSKTSFMYHLYADNVLPDPIFSPKDQKLRTIVVRGAPNRKMWKMERLRSLHLTADIEGLPSSIGNMKHLRYLDVSISKTKELSESVAKLYHLQTLNLSNSSIKELPEFITKLFNLETLNLSNSSIKELPESIDNLHSLQNLNVSNSNIIELPDTITKLHNLQTLNFLECKELTKLPRKKINNMIGLKHIAFTYAHQMPFGLGKLNGLETLMLFVVGSDWGGSIEELRCLNKLRGNLNLTRLEEVGDKREVERANLKEKAKMRGLSFEWSYGANDRSSRDEELLEGLQPHPNIERIKIKYYMGEKWSSWMSRMNNPCDGDSLLVLNNLVDLSLEQCWNCVQLPRLGDLPHLKFLKMSHMGKVERISNEFYGIDSKSSSIGCLRLFPALESLSMSRMENLTEWSSPSDGNKVLVFPCLENLYIQSCPKLTGFPMSDLSELVKLEIRDCEELRLLSRRQQSFTFLTSLSVVGCSKFTYLRNWLLSNTCFMELSVRRCKWLTFIPEDLGKVICLTSFEIHGCKRLRYFPEEIIRKLTRLQNLSIGAFSEELDSFCYLDGIKDLPCLEELEIWGSDIFGREMCCLPDQPQHLTVLKSLTIIGFITMETLPEWFTNLQSLQSLCLDYCRNLRCQSTATIIQHLPNLTHLNINCCPILEDSKSELFQTLNTARIKVEFSNVSKVKVHSGN